MIELSNKKDKSNRPSFNSDLKRLTELIKDDQFILEVTKKIFDFYGSIIDVQKSTLIDFFGLHIIDYLC